MCFFFNDTATTEIYTLSLHDALPICGSGRLEIALPEVDVDRRARLGRAAPQLGGVEANAVERVGLLALRVGVGVREYIGPVHAVDDAVLAARVAGQPRMSHRRVVAREDTIACREARRRSGLAVVGTLLRDPQHAIEQLGVRVRRRRVGSAGELGHAALELLARDHALLDEQPHVTVEPTLVVARGQVVDRRHPLDGVAALVDVENVLYAARPGEPEDPPFPGRVEDGLACLALDAPEAGHAAPIVDAVPVIWARGAHSNAAVPLPEKR